MRYGLLALSMAMLTSGAVAARSAFDITHSVEATLADAPRQADSTAGFGAMPGLSVKEAR